MTRTEDSHAARRRGECDRDCGSRPFDQAMHARRRLNTSQANRSGTRAGRHGPEHRYAYLNAIARLGKRLQGAQVPRAEVLSEVQGRDHKVMPTEHAPSEMLANEHYADHLVERIGWALVEAEEQEQAIRA
jgi:hypothetical protein